MTMHPTRAARATIWLTLLLTTVTTLTACGGAAEVGASPTATPVVPALPDDRGDATGGGEDPGSDDGSGSAPGGAPGGGGGNVVDPDQPVGGVPAPGDPQIPPDGALQVQPEPGIVNAIPHAWDRITIAPDGRTITVYFWGGVQDCYGLASVQVERDANGLLQVTVMEGQRGNLAPNTACDEIALLKAVTVALDDAIFAPAD
jgi:hypothetical protein